MYELIYTSAPRGLRASASGYTVVAQTTDIPAGLVSALEGLSQYRHRSVSANADDGVNPVMCGHYLLTVGYQRYHVLSRIVDSGLDYSGRGNFLAHHLATTDDRLPPGGPGWVLNHTDVFLDRWDKAPETLSPRGHMRAGDSPAKPCRAWKSATGDAGWGGVLAASVDPAHPVIIVFRPDQDVMALISESLALLPPDERWEVSFSSYYLGTPAGVRCQWRCVPSDSPDLSKLLASGSASVIRVDRMAEEAPEGPLVDAARTGNVPPPARKIHPASPPAAPIPVRNEVRAPAPQLARLPDIDDEEEPQTTLPPARPFAPPPSSGFAKLIAGFGIGALLMATILLGIEAISGKGILGLNDNKQQPIAEGVGAEKPVAPPEGITKADLDKAVLDAVARNEKKWDDKEAAATEARGKELAAEKNLTNAANKRADKADDKLKKLQSDYDNYVKAHPAKTEPTPSPSPVAAPESEEDSLMLYKSFLNKSPQPKTTIYNKSFSANSVVSFVEITESNITISEVKKEAVDGKGKATHDVKNGNVLIGRVELTTKGTDQTVEIVPLDANSQESDKLVTPGLQVGLLRVKNDQGTSYQLAYQPFVSTQQLMGKKQDKTKESKGIVWEKENLVVEITKVVRDYKEYLKTGGTLVFRGEATVKIGDSKEFITLTPTTNKPKNEITKLTNEKESISLEILKDGQLIVTTPLGVEKCLLMTAEVVRPVKIKDFKGTWLPVVKIAQMEIKPLGDRK